MAIPARGVQAIKTLSAVLGSGAHSNERHVHQFQLAAFELERARRTREKHAALRRIRELDARLAEIDTLMRRHQDALGVTQACARTGGDLHAGAGAAPSQTRRVLRYGGDMSAMRNEAPPKPGLRGQSRHIRTHSGRASTACVQHRGRNVTR